MRGMKKKLLSILLTICMIVGVVPTMAFASDNTNGVVQGYYDASGAWTEGKITQNYPDGVVAVDKTAVPTENPNEYDITLKVQTQQKTEIAAPGSAATVLVIDTSGSMGNYSRLSNAKKAASAFVDSYGGGTAGTGRYLAVVQFASATSVKLNWTDVSTEGGKKAANAAIDGLEADGGTNLHAGILQADVLLGKSPVAGLKKGLKNVVILTDGAPTYSVSQCDKKVHDKWWESGLCDNGHSVHFKIGGVRYGVEGSGSSGSADINKVTADAAKSLRAKVQDIYTICYGAEGTYTWGGWLSHGPTVDAYLKDSIASSADKAYIAADGTDKLNEAFEAISESITTGIDGTKLTVTDKAAPHVTITNLPENATQSNGNITWKLADSTPATSTEGDTTTYTYTLTYTVKVDADADGVSEDKYLPLNGKTTLKSGDNRVNVPFPIPAVKPVKSSHTVTYTDGVEGETIFEDKSFTVKHGANTPAFEGTPTREGYTFTGWSPAVETTVKGDATYVAQWKIKTYTVKWVNYDDTLLETDTGVKHGTRPEYNGADPTKPSSAECTYEFAGWEPAIERATKDITYKATYDGVINKYTVRWLNADGTVLETDKNVAYGTTPVYDGETPTKSADAQYTYTFKGWDKEIKEVTKNTDYTATYDKVINQYTVTYTDGVDGKTIFDDQVYTAKYGDTTPAFEGTPERKDYVFTGWNKEVAETVTGNATYVAQWADDKNNNGKPDSKDDHFTVTYKDGEEELAKFENVLVGTPTPTIENPEKTGYGFAGWNEEVAKTVTADAIYEAQWEANSYTITYKDGLDEALFKNVVKTAKFGEATPEFTGSLERTGYEFAGWKPTVLATVEDNATYVAQWKAIDCKVTYTDGVDGETIFEDQVYKTKYDATTPAFEGEPAREGYTFTGWYPELEATVTGNTTYRATWSKNAPNKPSKEDIQLLGLDITVDCINTNVNHANEEFKDIIDGTASSGSVQENDGVYESVVKVYYAEYVERYNEEIAEGHAVVGEADHAQIKVVWNDTEDEWELANEDDKNIIIEVDCGSEMPEPPTKPEVKELDIYATVECVHNSKHPVMELMGDELIDDSITIGAVTLNKDEYNVNVTVKFDEYADYYSEVVDSDHVVSGDEDSMVIELTWNDENEEWEISNEDFDEEKGLEIYIPVTCEHGELTVIFKGGKYGEILGKRKLTRTEGEKVDYVPDVIPIPGFEFEGWYCPELEEEFSSREVKRIKVNEDLTFIAQYYYDDDYDDHGDGHSLPQVEYKPVKPELEKEEHFQYISGYPDGTVRPEANITRAEVASIFYRLLNDNTRNSYYSTYTSFKDVDASQWYLKAVATLTRAGILHGDADGTTFRPNDSITRAEFATIVSFFDELEPATQNYFSDIDGHWAASYINSAYQKGWISGYPDGTFNPNAAITRAEAATLINNVLGRGVDADGLCAYVKQWPDNPAHAWYYYQILEATNYHEYTRDTETNKENWTEIKPNKVWNEGSAN